MMEGRDPLELNAEHVCYQSTSDQQQEGKERSIRCGHDLVLTLLFLILILIFLILILIL